ncbi:MAG: aminopeptidase P N-terminal domain-containing protein [Planctomycetota bacterium]|jgi:Xaa-Pro aminopeptidase
MSFLDKRRKSILKAWDLQDEIVLVPAGALVPIPGTDLNYPFRAHPEHRYLADSDLPGQVLAYDGEEGWTVFVPVPTDEEKVWEGGAEADGLPIAHLKDWLDVRRGRPVAMLGEPLPGIDFSEELSRRVRDAVTAARRIKDTEELGRIRRAAGATREGFAIAKSRAQPGTTERLLRIEVDAAMLRAGATHMAFDTIVAGGPNGAVFHFMPTDRELKKGEFCIVDAGAEYAGYASDVTRTYVAGGTPTAEQRELYALVLETQREAIAKCRPGKEYKELHLESCAQLAQGLVDFGLLKGKAEDLVEQGAHALFFPHGLGHLMGLAVHDAGGYLDGRARSEEFGLNFLRTDLPLEENYVVTIEPGLYFVPALLLDPGRRELFKSAVDWKRAETMLHLGGIRIEDDVLVTDGEPEILTPEIPHELT